MSDHGSPPPEAVLPGWDSPRSAAWWAAVPRAPCKAQPTSRRMHRYHIRRGCMPAAGDVRLFGFRVDGGVEGAPGVTVHFDALGLGVQTGAFMMIDRSQGTWDDSWLRLTYSIDRTRDMTFNFRLLPVSGEEDVYHLDDLDVFTLITHRDVRTRLAFDGEDATPRTLVQRLD